MTHRAGLSVVALVLALLSIVVTAYPLLLLAVVCLALANLL